MRYSLLILFVLLFTDITDAQRARVPRLGGVWIETSIGRNGGLINPNRQPRRSTLILDQNGFFEEVRAGRSRRYDDVVFSGRWDVDYRRGFLNLALDQGFADGDRFGRNRNNCPPPGRGRLRGRDVIRYEIIYNDRDELVLRDRRTGRKRAFVRERPSRRDFYRR
jgi:hypothetical protein